MSLVEKYHGSSLTDDDTREGQDRPLRPARQTIAYIRRILEEAQGFRANPDLDPIRKGRPRARAVRA